MIEAIKDKLKMKKDFINMHSIGAYENMNFSNPVITGRIMEKNKKDIRIKTDTNEIFDIRTKINIDVKKGSMLNIKKSEVESIVKVSDEQVKKEKEKIKDQQDELKNLDLKDTKENQDALKNIKLHEIPPTKENILKFANIKDQINNLSVMDIDMITKLFARGYDIENMSMEKLREVSGKLDITESVKSEKISYDKAREISDKIYSQKMGKDIYDIIIALKQNAADVNKENIDKIHDTLAKLSDIQDIDSNSLVKAISQSRDISIDLLYKIKNYVVNSSVKASGQVRYTSSSKGEIVIDNNITEQIKKFLKENSLEDDFEIAKAIVQNNIDLNLQNIKDVKDLQDIVQKVQQLMDKEVAAILIRDNDDIAGMDIKDLLKQIEQIKSGQNPFDNLKLSRDEKRLSNQFIKAIKGIRAEDLISGNTRLNSLINSNTISNQLYNKLYNSVNIKSTYTGFSIYKFAHTFEKLSINQQEFNSIDKNKNLSISYISEKYGLLSETDKSKALNLKALTYTKADDDFSLFRHYDYLKNNLRAYHINKMLKDNIDPLNTDIRKINQIIQNQRQSIENILKTRSSIDSENINEISSGILNSQTDFTISNIKKTADIINNANNYSNLFEKLKKEAKNRNFTEIENSVKKIEASLRHYDRDGYKNQLKEDIKDIYSQINKINEIISKSERKDSEVFKEIVDDIDKNIRQTAENIKSFEMIQIPFYLNDQSSNANVYAKTKKNKKGKIDPEDMSILVDINTKKLGKLGFYLKVDKKNIKIKISGENDIVKAVRSSMENLDKNLQEIGYEIKNLDIVSPENKAKIEFVNENRRISNSSIDLMI